MNHRRAIGIIISLTQLHTFFIIRTIITGMLFCFLIFSMTSFSFGLVFYNHISAQIIIILQALILRIFTKHIMYNFHGFFKISRCFLIYMIRIKTHSQCRKCCTIMCIIKLHLVKTRNGPRSIIFCLFILFCQNGCICQICICDGDFKIRFLCCNNFQCFYQIIHGFLIIRKFLIQKTDIIIQTGKQHIVRRKKL